MFMYDSPVVDPAREHELEMVPKSGHLGPATRLSPHEPLA